MKNLYKEKFVVDDTYLNFTNNVPIHDIVRIIERVAFNHANAIGLDHLTMEKRDNAFWVVTKMKIKLISPIRVGETLTLSTWTHTPELVRFKRDGLIKAGNKVRVKSTTEWCCLDMSNHRIRKASTIGYPAMEMVCTDDVKADYTNLKADMTEKDYVYTYTVRSTDIDLNRHTNNTKYNFMAENAFTVEQFSALNIGEWEVYFVNESHEGDNIKIYKRKIKNCYLIEGKIDEKTIFRAVAKLKRK